MVGVCDFFASHFFVFLLAASISTFFRFFRFYFVLFYIVDF